MSITPYLKYQAFDPADIDTMSKALFEVCSVLNINENATARELVAIRIIEITTRGERDPIILRDRILSEISSSSGC